MQSVYYGKSKGEVALQVKLKSSCPPSRRRLILFYEFKGDLRVHVR